MTKMPKFTHLTDETGRGYRKSLCGSMTNSPLSRTTATREEVDFIVGSKYASPLCPKCAAAFLVREVAAGVIA